MTGQTVPCGSSTTTPSSSLLNTNKNQPTTSSSFSSSPAQATLSPSSSTSSIHLIPNLVWSETISMDDQQQQQRQQQQHYLKKVTLVPDPLAASVAAAEEAAAAAASNPTTATSSTTTSTQSDRVPQSEGYSSASSHDNLPLAHVARALVLPPPTAITSAAAELAATTAYAASLSAAASTTNNNTVAEFLYQLTKLLSDDNRDIIEWSNGKIEVHSPQKLESHVLHKYFRHSKFASFQRQLNYFGFRKLAGKGKMAPCSYVNDDTTQELRSLLLIKRKASLTQSGQEKTKRKRDRSNSGMGSQGSTGTAASSNPNNHNAMVNPVLAGILQRSTLTLPLPTAVVVGPILANPLAASHHHPRKGSVIHDPLAVSSNAGGLHNMMTPQALAQAAVGKGIKHGLRAPIPAPIVPLPPPAAAPAVAVAPPPPTAVTTILPIILPSTTTSSVATTTVSNVATMAMPSKQTPYQPHQQPTHQQQPHPNPNKGELLYLPDAQISHSIQESLSQLTNNFRNSLNELREQGDAASGGESEQDGGTRSMSPGGVGLFMLSRNSSLVDLAMLDVQNEEDDDDEDADGTNGNHRYLMPFVDFPHQDLIPTDQQQQQQQVTPSDQPQQLLSQQSHEISAPPQGQGASS